jgi:hypothetical protein
MNTVPTVNTWQTALLDASSNLLTSIALFIPNLLGALILFFVGVVLSGWIKSLTVRLLSGLNLSKLFQGTTFSKFLEHADLTTKIEQVIGELLRLLVVLIFFIASINLLGLTTVTEVLNRILNYLPHVFAATLIIAIGTIIAGLVEKIVKGSLGTVDVKTSRLLAKISSYIVMVFTILAAMSQLGIAATFVNTLFIGFVAMLTIGLGLSLGLGSKDLVKTILEDWYKDFKKQVK